VKKVKRRYALWLTILIVAGGVAFFFFAGDGQPVRYNGQDAFEWAVRLEWPPEPKSQEEAAAALRAMGTDAVPLLRQRLSEKVSFSQQVRGWLGAKLPGSMGRLFTQGLKPVSKTSTYCSAALGLKALSTNAAPAVPDLVRVLQSCDRQTLWYVANALGQIGEAAVLPLIPLLNDPNADVRHATAYALGQIGSPALAAAPNLVQRLSETNPSIRAAAIFALAQIGPKAGPAVLKIVQERRGEDQRNAARALVGIHPRSQLSRPVLAEMAQDSDPASRAVAIETMSLLLLVRTNDMPIYLAGLSDPNAEVRLAAAKALAQAAPRARDATPTLIAMKDNDPDEAVRAAADVALAKIAEAFREKQ
jgi:HEAT repeat protein